MVRCYILIVICLIEEYFLIHGIKKAFEISSRGKDLYCFASIDIFLSNLHTNRMYKKNDIITVKSMEEETTLA